MKCAWDAFLGIIPHWMRCNVDKLSSKDLQELRLRLYKKPELITSRKVLYLDRPVSEEDLQFCINTASKYSPWSAQTSKNGYITAPGGHRIGLCGQASVTDDRILGIRFPNALCIRIARDFPGIAREAKNLKGSVLIIGSPGCGKTTLLRDLIRIRSDYQSGSVGVVDEKGELFPLYNNSFCFDTGQRTDILTGCLKKQGIDILIRNMGPATIAVDEITSLDDCAALAAAGWCGVELLATAHAANKKELFTRKVYRQILDGGLFANLFVLRQDKSWYAERLES